MSNNGMLDLVTNFVFDVKVIDFLDIASKFELIWKVSVCKILY